MECDYLSHALSFLENEKAVALAFKQIDHQCYAKVAQALASDGRLPSNIRLDRAMISSPAGSDTGFTARSLDTVACLGNSVLDGPRAGYRDSDNLVAGGRDDLVGAAARRCWVVEEALR